ncbi:MAG: hypothetical protein OEW06_10850 [Gemmatimonadota bacterium]|jgi:hypothetical protein|nr:hypothetical protein [Gemmatimonadota bacterium]
MRVYLRQEDGETALDDVEPILFAMRGLAKRWPGMISALRQTSTGRRR